MEEQEKSLRHRLNTMFSRYNYVGIKNILKTPIEWTVALEQHEILDMSAGGMSEEDMIRNKSGNFLPTDGVTRGKQKTVTYRLEPGEKKMVIGEAAYVLIDKIYTLFIKEKFVPKVEPGTVPDQRHLALTKAGMAKLRNQTEQNKYLPQILVGPIINNVEGAIQTYATEQMSKLNDGFSDIQTAQPQKAASNGRARKEAPTVS